MAVYSGGQRVTLGVVTGVAVPYELQPATKEALGGLIVGSGLKVDPFGLVELDPVVDSKPTIGSKNLVTSGAIAQSLSEKADAGHTHQEIITVLESKSDKGHSHAGMVTSANISQIIVSDTEPTDEDGSDGDLWFVYKN